MIIFGRMVKQLMTAKASEVLFNAQSSVAPLGLIALEGAKELGNQINNYLVEWAKKGLSLIHI